MIKRRSCVQERLAAASVAPDWETDFAISFIKLSNLSCRKAFLHVLKFMF